MRTQFSAYKFVPLALTLVAILGGCAGTDTEEKPVEPSIATEPPWVRGDCASFWGGRLEHRLCSVGSATLATSSGARVQATRQARSGISATLGPRVHAVIARFGQTGDGKKEFGDPVDAGLVRRISDRISKVAALAARPVSIYVSDRNTAHILVSLTQDEWTRTVSDMDELPAALREAVTSGITAEFAGMERQITGRD